MAARQYKTELLWLQAQQPERQARIWAQLKATLPEYDRLLIGWDEILGFLAQAGVRRPNCTEPLSYRMVRRWIASGFPLVRGGYRLKHASSVPSITSQHALIAWLLSQPEVAPFRNDLPTFGACHDLKPRPPGKRARERTFNRFKGLGRPVGPKMGFATTLEESHGERKPRENAQGGENPS